MLAQNICRLRNSFFETFFEKICYFAHNLDFRDEDFCLKLYFDDFCKKGNFSRNKLCIDFLKRGHKFASSQKQKRHFNFNPDIKPQRTPACRNFLGKSIGPKQVVHACG